MPTPVWSLSVDLQTKSATFTSGLADAAKGARSSFQDIKDSADDMGRGMGGSMSEARHGVMLLGEEFGVHLPRSLTTFIASIGPIGAAMEAAFPFLAILVGATLLIEHLSKLKAEGEKLTESQLNFGTTVANVMNGLDDKLLEAGIRTDELNHNHLGALEKQLKLIDHATFNELARSFDTIAKAADSTFADMKASFTESFFDISKGSAGAKHALDEFKASYDSLLAQHKDKEASDLLAGTLDSAKKSYDLMQAQQGGHGSDEKELQAQAKLVEVLQDQIEVRAKLNALKDVQSSNARQTADSAVGADGDKAAREQAQNDRKAIEDADKLWEENYRAAVSRLQENEREKIDATKQGSTARLAAIDSAIHEEESKGLQETGMYKSLLTARVEMVRQMAEEEKKIKAEAGKESAEHEYKMGELANAARHDQEELRISGLMNQARAQMAEETRMANEEYALKTKQGQQEMAALDKSDKEYENKVKALNDKQLELTRAHENQITQIRVKAEEERNGRIVSAEKKMDDELAKSMTSLLMRHQSFAKMMVSLGDQVIGGMMETAIKSVLANDFTKESDAAAAARKAYLAGMHFPFPANIVMGPALGAMAFASVMAFQEGGLVPGVGSGDIVPARLEPGEGIITKKVMEGLSNRAKFGDADKGGGDTHIHLHSNPTIHALDSDGFARVLDKHSDTLVKHVHSTLRKMNR